MPNLVGIGNSQVPTNAMLGGLAYQDSVGEINLEKIKARAVGTAVDIFVYDTSKDSDGGAWRHRTQNTSWYNEGVSETRGARKEFPAVAVIVAEQNFITIYDGDDPNLPMWMVFNTIAGGNSQGMADRPMVQLQGVDKVVHMLNGILATGTKNEGSNYGQPIINFINERVLRMDSQGGEGGEWMGNIAQRNDAIGYRHVTYDYVIAASHVNDVAMTVLPNAPIDESTGLPIPTIAVATNGGTNVINDNGTVTEGYQTIATQNVDLHPDGFMTDGISGATNDSFSLYKIGTTDRLVSYGHRADAQVINTFLNEGTGECLFEGKSNKIAIAQSQGLLRIVEEIDIERANDGISLGLHNRTASSYNTGWMVADVKGAFMSDTDTTDATYSTVADDWATAGAWTKQGSITISSTGSGTSGTLSITGNGTGSNVYFFNPITVEANTDYVVSITFGAENANTFVINTTQYNAGTGVLLDINALSGLTRGGHFNSGSNTTLYIQGWQTSTSATTITNLVIQKVSEKDRSVNNKGLLVLGTVTKSAVATDAELVSYGPFSTSNRLRQPYNSDLNVETNDFSIMFWMNNNGTNSHQTLVSRDNREFDVSILDNDTYSRRFRIYADQSNDSSNNFDSNDDPFPLNVWSHVCVNYTGGNTVSIYVNGVLNKSGTLNYDIDDTSHGLNIGARNTSGSYAHAADGTKLALVRISKGAPSPEQIKKIYSDEKCLFHEEAKCTLSGTSDAITGLGFDDTTDVLHAGTSSGRSEFQGLNRINNTTTAVTTTISASNEFIAEQ